MFRLKRMLNAMPIQSTDVTSSLGQLRMRRIGRLSPLVGENGAGTKIMDYALVVGVFL